MSRKRAGARLKNANAVSAGGVLYRSIQPSRYQVALVGRSSQGTWGLPKGTPAEGESLEQTAVREVSEETGIEPKVIAHLGSIQYYFVARNTRFHKIVHFYLMEGIGGDVSQHDHEYDLVEWFDLDEALERLSYPNEVEMVRGARAKLLGIPHEKPAPPKRESNGSAAAS